MTTHDNPFSRAATLAKAALSTLRADPRLFVFPLIAFVVHAGYAGLCALLLRARVHFSSVEAHEYGFPAAFLVHYSDGREMGFVPGLLAYIGAQVISVTCAVALTHAALEALAGRPWTIADAFAVSRRRRSAVAGYAMIRAGAGMVLRNASRHGGSVGPVRKVARLTWRLMNFLAIPVLARESVGPVATIQRASALLGTTWKEGVFGRWVLWWLWIPHVGICAVPLLVCVGLGVDEPTIWFTVVLLSASMVGFGGVVIATLDGIYRAALYVFATEGVVPGAFDDPDLHTLWYARSDATAPTTTIDVDATPDPSTDVKTETDAKPEADTEVNANDEVKAEPDSDPETNPKK